MCIEITMQVSYIFLTIYHKQYIGVKKICDRFYIYTKIGKFWYKMLSFSLNEKLRGLNVFSFTYVDLNCFSTTDLKI